MSRKSRRLRGEKKPRPLAVSLFTPEGLRQWREDASGDVARRNVSLEALKEGRVCLPSEVAQAFRVGQPIPTRVRAEEAVSQERLGTGYLLCGMRDTANNRRSLRQFQLRWRREKDGKDRSGGVKGINPCAKSMVRVTFVEKRGDVVYVSVDGPAEALEEICVATWCQSIEKRYRPHGSNSAVSALPGVPSQVKTERRQQGNFAASLPVPTHQKFLGCRMV